MRACPRMAAPQGGAAAFAAFGAPPAAHCAGPCGRAAVPWRQRGREGRHQPWASPCLAVPAAPLAPAAQLRLPARAPQPHHPMHTHPCPCSPTDQGGGAAHHQARLPATHSQAGSGLCAGAARHAGEPGLQPATGMPRGGALKLNVSSLKAWQAGKMRWVPSAAPWLAARQCPLVAKAIVSCRVGAGAALLLAGGAAAVRGAVLPAKDGAAAGAGAARTRRGRAQRRQEWQAAADSRSSASSTSGRAAFGQRPASACCCMMYFVHLCSFLSSHPFFRW